MSASQKQAVFGSISVYDTGYNYGCSDAKISNPSNRYINQPGKSSGFHSGEVMSGYNDGFRTCSMAGGSGGSGIGTYAQGQRDGRAEGFRDAINGRPSDDRCPFGRSNLYCLGYKLAYNWEYQVTKFLPRK